MLQWVGGRSPCRLFPEKSLLAGGPAKAATAPMRMLTLPPGIPQHPPEATTGFSEILCLGPSCQKAIGHPDGSVQEHLPSTTLGLQAWDSPSHVPSPWSGNQRLLKRNTMEISLSCPGSHSTTTHPLKGGGLLSEHWTVNLQKNPLHLQGKAELPQPGSSMPMLDQSQTLTVCVGNNNQHRCLVLD